MATVEEVLADTEERMNKSVEALKRELSTIRTGRASPALVENLMVDYYGVPTPLNQLASISVPEARMLMIQPWDKQSMKDVEKGILRSDLGLTPNNDGSVIRINIPTLTEERRRDLVKLVGRKAEEANVAVRNIRRDSLETFRSMEKSKDNIACEHHPQLLVTTEAEEVLAQYRAEQIEQKLFLLVEDLVQELVKDQGEVHAATVYGVVNLLQRHAPGPVFHALISNSRLQQLDDQLTFKLAMA